jgi:hypothetical protein
MLLGIAEQSWLGSVVLATSGGVLFFLCLVAFVIFEYFVVQSAPDEERPSELRGPIPGGLRWGHWYYNPNDPRWAAFSAKGHPIVNYAHPRNCPLLILAMAGLAIAIGMVISSALTWLRE